jgi:transposase InsO family protein
MDVKHVPAVCYSDSVPQKFYQYTVIDEFIKKLDEYLHWYNEKRSKKSLGFLSPMEYRQTLGIAV